MTVIEIGKKLKEIRIQRGFSQEFLANKAGLSRITIIRIENGEHSAKLTVLIKVLKALDLKIDKIFE